MAHQPFHSISRVNNMDALRYLLAFGVILAHINEMAGMHCWWPYHSSASVGGFFALSGFLLFNSFQRRPTWRDYLGRRARRILPPYILVVVLTAIGMAGVSSLMASEYFASTGFWKYLAANLSFLNFLHPDLPGVFKGEAVNGALWTMKGEWICYLSIPLIFPIIKRCDRWGWVPLVVLILLSLIGFNVFHELHSDVLAKQFGGLIVYFYCGALFNYFMPWIMRHKWPMLLLALLLIYLGPILSEEIYHRILRAPAITLLVLWLSIVGSWGHHISRHDNVSYDMYLYHMPIIKLAVYFGLTTILSPWLTVAALTFTTWLVALLSWNLIGRRFQAKA